MRSAGQSLCRSSPSGHAREGAPPPCLQRQGGRHRCMHHDGFLCEQVLRHPQRGVRREVREERQMVLQCARHGHSLLHRDPSGEAAPWGGTCMHCTSLIPQWLSKWGIWAAAGEGAAARVPAAPGQPAGRPAAGVLRVRLAQRLRARLRAREEREQRRPALQARTLAAWQLRLEQNP